MQGSTGYIQRSPSVQRVIYALNEFFVASAASVHAENFVSTREIADRSELSIYNTRHILIKLEKEGILISVKKRKSLYWNRTDYF